MLDKDLTDWLTYFQSQTIQAQIVEVYSYSKLHPKFYEWRTNAFLSSIRTNPHPPTAQQKLWLTSIIEQYVTEVIRQHDQYNQPTPRPEA